MKKLLGWFLFALTPASFFVIFALHDGWKEALIFLAIFIILPAYAILTSWLLASD